MAEDLDVKRIATPIVVSLLKVSNELWLAVCCSRVYVGIEPAKRCGACGSTPNNSRIQSVEDLG